ncbi:MAG: hypothetical protein M3Z65_06265 [Chloroflexota bacterium]|nr:hypothetical protein [Chloroflexota bacterium]
MSDDLSRIATATRVALPAEVPSRHVPPVVRPRFSLEGVLELIYAQVPVVNRNIWAASAVVIGSGCAVTLFGSSGGTSGVFGAITPLIAAAGVAVVYGDHDPSLEVALATPTSPRAILLARLALVCGYDLLLALAASVVLVGIGQSAGGLEAVIFMWLGPMLLLSAIGLGVAVRFGSAASLATAGSLWILNLTAAPTIEHAVARATALDSATGTGISVALALVIIGAVVLRTPRVLRAA